MAAIENKKILLVDDEIEVCKVIREYLEKKKFQVYEAHNGKEALEAIKKIVPDLIILDVLMPVMDGFEVLQKVKRNKSYADIPVIMLTVRSEPEHLNKGISLQADFYLPKPFQLGNLMSFINLIVKG